MNTNTAGANSPYDDSIAETVNSFVETVTSALQSTDADTDAVEAVETKGKELANTVEETISQQQETINELEQTVEEQPDFEVTDDSDPIGSITVDGAPLGRAIQSKASKTDVEQVIDDVEGRGSNDTDDSTDEYTPIEQLSQSDDLSEVTDSVSVERAVSLFTNLPKWGKKTPKGIVLRPADNPLSLLEADRDESLAWRQYYRAAKALERLSRGAVTFVDSDRHGKMLVLHEQSDVYERLVDGTLTPSSVGAEV